MANDLINAFANDSRIPSEELVSLNIGIKKRTGEKFAKATTSDGKTYIKTLTRSGVSQNTMIEIPAYSTREERDVIIKELSKKHTQDDIADMLGVSQGTVSNSLRKNRNRNK